MCTVIAWRACKVCRGVSKSCSLSLIGPQNLDLVDLLVLRSSLPILRLPVVRWALVSVCANWTMGVYGIPYGLTVLVPRRKYDRIWKSPR